MPRALTLQAVCRVRSPVQRGTVGERLHFARAGADTHFYAPDFTDFCEALTLHALAWSKDDLLLVLDFVTAEQPASSVLDQVAVIGLDKLLEQLCDLGLAVGLLRLRLLLLLFRSGSEHARRHHHPQKKLVGVVGGQSKVGRAASDFLRADEDRVAGNGAESVNLGTELDLNCLLRLERRLRFLVVGHKRGVGGHVGARRDRAWVRDTLDDLLTLVDLGNFIL